MKKLPGKIRIGPVDFDIEIVEGLLDIEKVDKVNGYIRFNRGVIRIEKDQHPSLLFLTLVHEMVHGIASYADVELDEHGTERFANLLVVVLRDNPEFVEFCRDLK